MESCATLNRSFLKEAMKCLRTILIKIATIREHAFESMLTRFGNRQAQEINHDHLKLHDKCVSEFSQKFSMMTIRNEYLTLWFILSSVQLARTPTNTDDFHHIQV